MSLVKNRWIPPRDWVEPFTRKKQQQTNKKEHIIAKNNRTMPSGSQLPQTHRFPLSFWRFPGLIPEPTGKRPIAIQHQVEGSFDPLSSGSTKTLGFLSFLFKYQPHFWASSGSGLFPCRTAVQRPQNAASPANTVATVVVSTILSL